MAAAARRPALAALLVFVALVACQGRPLVEVSCPLALAGGQLVEHAGTLALAGDAGDPTPVVWPDGVAVARVGDRLALVGFFGHVIAAEGDTVTVGGGYGPDDRFHACGELRLSDGET